jgi:uncharacterized membrane protein
VEDAMALAQLIAGLILFLGVHWITTHRDLRAALVRPLGEGGYKILYSVISLVGLVLIVRGFALSRASYSGANWYHIWSSPTWMRHVTVALMLPAVILVVAAYLRGKIYTAVKHPMLAGVKLWAFAHLLVNGDVGGILLFGSFLAWAVYDRISLKHRSDPGAPPIPVGGVFNDVLAVVIGIVVYLALGFVFHPAVIGVPVFGA